MVLAVIPIASLVRADNNVVLTDGTVLTASISATSITVPVGASVRYAADIVLEATGSIVIEGQLLGNGPSGGANAFGISLVAGSVTVTGSVVGAPGLSRAAETSSSSTTGTAGGDGGSVAISWGSLSTLNLASGARIESGAGGNGADVTVTAVSGAPSELTATGGAGGRGGDLTLNGVAAVFNGNLVLGNGGSGGKGEVTAPGDTIPEASALTGVGGNGGSSGAIQLPPSYTVAQMYGTKLSGGAGGSGGEGLASAAAACTGSNGVYPNINGGRGCDGASATGRGGPGGCSTSASTVCLIGGPGGTGWGYAQDAGSGGRGANGQVSLTNPNSILGGNGGAGGTGGYGQGIGGTGGSGVLRGGRGGDAHAAGGWGGNGGNGGNSGYILKGSSGIAWPINCSMRYPACWLSLTPDIGCGHIGAGGAEGLGGGAAATRGNPGSSTAGINDGPGTQTAGPGPGGDGGSPGSYGPECAHNYGHSHVA